MILVTGASGFLGKHLIDALREKGVPTRALYHSNPPQEEPPHSTIEWKACDLLDISALLESMEGVDIVIHTAAIVSFDPRKKQEMIELNVNMSAQVVNVALDENIQRLIHVSSIAALGRALQPGQKIYDDAIEIDEESYWVESKNNSSYAKSKYLSELEVWRGMAEGLNAVIINPSLILGEGDWTKGSAQLMDVVAKEFPWFTNGINGWVDVKDVVKAILLLIDSPIKETRYIINNGNYSYKDIFSQMAQLLNKKPPHRKASPWMTEIVWRIELLKSRLLGKEAVITKESARTAQTKCLYDNQKFLKDFPQFHYTPIEETLKRMAEAYQKK